LKLPAIIRRVFLGSDNKDCFMSTALHFARDTQGYSADAPQFPTDIYTATLAASGASSITVPSNFSTWVMYVRVQPNGWVWVRNGGTAAIPAGATFAASSSELVCGTIEYRRAVKAGDVISFITANTTCDIEVAFQATSYTA
jgi:hypothetical protein